MMSRHLQQPDPYPALYRLACWAKQEQHSCYWPGQAQAHSSPALRSKHVNRKPPAPRKTVLTTSMLPTSILHCASWTRHADQGRALDLSYTPPWRSVPCGVNAATRRLEGVKVAGSNLVAACSVLRQAFVPCT